MTTPTPNCGGNGYTVEPSHTAQCDPNNGGCSPYCPEPEQVQCPGCDHPDCSAKKCATCGKKPCRPPRECPNLNLRHLQNMCHGHDPHPTCGECGATKCTPAEGYPHDEECNLLCHAFLGEEHGEPTHPTPKADDFKERGYHSKSEMRRIETLRPDPTPKVDDEWEEEWEKHLRKEAWWIFEPCSRSENKHAEICQCYRGNAEAVVRRGANFIRTLLASREAAAERRGAEKERDRCIEAIVDNHEGSCVGDAACWNYAELLTAICNPNDKTV